MVKLGVHLVVQRRGRWRWVVDAADMRPTLFRYTSLHTSTTHISLLIIIIINGLFTAKQGLCATID